jgi:hypothetical protein
MKANKKYSKGGKTIVMGKYVGGGEVDPDPKKKKIKDDGLDQVVVTGKKGAGVEEASVVGRGKTGAEYTAKRQELLAAELAKLQKGKAPGYNPTARERSDANDRVREQLYKEGYQEQGVIRKDTKKRLSPEDEAYAKERMGR